MKCDTYDEVKNGLKMAIVGLALGAAMWFFAGEKRREAAERRQYARERDRRKDKAAAVDLVRNADFSGLWRRTS